MATSNPKAPFQLNGYKIKWSKKEQLWYVYKGKKQVTVFQAKENARKCAELN